jgi:hypothetical protein
LHKVDNIDIYQFELIRIISKIKNVDYVRKRFRNLRHLGVTK